MKATAEQWLALGVTMPDIAVRIADGGAIPIQAILLAEPDVTERDVRETKRLAERHGW